MSHRTFAAGALVLGITLAFASGGDDTNDTSADGGGHKDTGVPNPVDGGGFDATLDDADVPDSAGPDTSVPDAKTDGGTDAADADAGPCNFAAFVVDIIQNKTSDKSLPQTNLGEACIDNQNKAEFSVLFP